MFFSMKSWPQNHLVQLMPDSLTWLCMCMCVCMQFGFRPIKFLLHPLLRQLIYKHMVQMASSYNDHDLFAESLPKSATLTLLQLWHVARLLEKAAHIDLEWGGCETKNANGQRHVVYNQNVKWLKYICCVILENPDASAAFFFFF